ncbi:iron uptake system protein EfeO [uncultured Friedmanniella sp.]|uniref:iron uptake system protein EfeO n=1 Tax=uncultured Friedmanniella sp. TaxID=335381 RepID=UPI0035CBFE1E
MTGPRPVRGLALASTTALLCVPVLAGCTTNTPASDSANDAGDSRALTVQATDSGCQVSSASAPSGNLTFSVTNTGSKVNEFYLLGADGLRILGEVENIGPGLSRDLVLSTPPGSYFTACKPGMIGDGIRAPFAVSDSGVSLTNDDDRALVATANKQYKAYVQDQTEQLVTMTDEFVTAYLAGNDDKAREIYPLARVHWERIEPVAESFGDLDPKTDLREADLEPGQKWTGWHRIEKDLWPAKAKNYTPLTQAGRKAYAADLVKNIATLNTKARTVNFTVDQIANGSRGLLDEVATSKVTGEEETWSRTDLYDFQANVDGARVGFEGLRPILQKKNPELDTQIDARFTALQKLLDKHKSGDGFVSYDDLSKPDVKALSDAVNALAEPLSKLTAAVV